VFNQQGSFVIEDINSGNLVNDLRVSFKVRMDRPDGNERADGMSFSFGSGIPNASIGENGAGNGLRVLFDPFPNNEERIVVQYAGSTVANTSPGIADFSLDTGTEFVDVEIELKSNGQFSLWWDGSAVFTNVATAFRGATGWRMAFGARTGGKKQLNYIDDLEIHDFNGKTEFFIDGISVGESAAQQRLAITHIGNYPHGGIDHHIGYVDEIRVWDGARTAGQIAANDNQPLSGFETGLVAYYSFDDGTVDDGRVDDQTGSGNGALFGGGSGNELAATYAAGGATFDLFGTLGLFPDDTSADLRAEALSPEFSDTKFTHTPTDVDSGQRLIQDWLRITWRWEKEFKVTLDTASLVADQSASDFRTLPYLLVDGVEVLSDAGFVYVPEFSEITAGTNYRTPGNCYTAVDLLASGDLEGVTYGDLVDSTHDAGSGRSHTHALLRAPVDVVFRYDKTKFRAELPLGAGLDISQDLVADALDQLRPNLCQGAQLDTINGPQAFLPLNSDSPKPARWDGVGLQVLPVAPGLFRAEWPDIDPAKGTYHIDIVADFPDEPDVPLGWEREDDQGYRLDDDGNRILGTANVAATTVDLAPSTDAFPASPDAHYHYRYNGSALAASDHPPVELDPNPADRWAFNELTYSTNPGGVSVPLGGTAFDATVDARSVLLFSYRPNPTGVATGDLTKEALVTRVVKSGDIASETFSSSDFIVGEAGNARIDAAGGNVLAIEASNTNIFPAQNRTLEFWFKADPGSVLSGERLVLQSGVAVESGGSARTRIFTMGFRGFSEAQPGALFIEDTDGVGGAVLATRVFPDVLLPEGWNHWAVVFGNAETSVYVNGLWTGEAEAALNPPFGAADVLWEFGRDVGNPVTPVVTGQLDNLRLWGAAITSTQIRANNRNPGALVGGTPRLSVSFDSAYTPPTYPNEGGSGDVTTIQVPSGMVQTTGAEAITEVATRVLSKFDTAGLDSGFLLNEISNYNANLYDRAAAFGTWGPVFPVNWSGLFDGADSKLATAYYENPNRVVPFSTGLLHPNVSWSHMALTYDDVEFPAVGEHKDKRVYIASRLGTEGVDAGGADQPVFDPAQISDLSIYNQPDPTVAGRNPNEEHALIAPSIKDQITGDAAFNLGQDAAFALQDELNLWGETDSNTGTTANDKDEFTSEPWVLVQFQNLETEEWEMAAYKVEQERTGVYEFRYAFNAGDIVVQPYPVNRVVGNLIMTDDAGGNVLLTGSKYQRTVWFDKNEIAWVVSGDGLFFYQFWYPFRDGFWFDRNNDGTDDIPVGEPVAWVPSNGYFTKGGTTTPEPQKVLFDTFWKTTYPKLKRGETVTHVGGENKAENPLDEGLPGIVAWASSEVVFDSNTPSMIFHGTESTFAGKENIDDYSARVTRPLDRYEFDMAATDMPETLQPASKEKVMVVGARWYFTDLSGSLQNRFYYDSLRQKLVFRGLLNGLESGDPDLTSTPISLFVLEPNVLSPGAYTALGNLSSAGNWQTAIDDLYLQSQDPRDLTGVTAPSTSSPRYYAGLEDRDSSTKSVTFFDRHLNPIVLDATSSGTGVAGPVKTVWQPLRSLGTGAALVPNSSLLTADTAETYYLTLFENNHPDATGAVAIHIIEIVPERFRGAIKVIEPANVFDEKINLSHTGDFGGNTAGTYYQWWIRDVASLDAAGLPVDNGDWQLYAEGLGKNLISFSGRPDITLADKLFYVRYGEKDELGDVTGQSNTITDDETAAVTADSWGLVDIDDPFDNWYRAGFANTNNGAGDPVPFQWAGASNSPQLQADGSKRYIPQLVMGWVKRVLDRINPYEARFTDFYNNESPAIYSSMLQIAGKPFIGKVALNAEKNVIEGVGLIELYETVLKRAKELTLEIEGAATPGTNQAILLAATRLGALYELLASEAYADAQDPTVRVTAEDGQVSDDDEFGLATSTSFAHAFMEQEASVLHEELALLRGTDFLKSYPAFNRLMWNYVKGLGEAAYNANYNIHDTNEDGFINEFDAAEQYPMGHGDAWGHYLSSSKMHYELLRNLAFDWEAVPELYSLLDNVIEADYLDEKTFARNAAAKARAGQQILTATYRLAYTEEPAGQWQGYTDVDSDRAWGVSEWGKRVGHATLFDWAVGNAIVPADADQAADDDEENLEEIDRQANQAELSEIAVGLLTVQNKMDEANGGFNPLGFDRDTVAFDIDPVLFNLSESEPMGHFPQLYEHARFTIENAMGALGLAVESDLKLRVIGDDTRELQIEALRQDIDYRNALIEIFGTPYEGTIGPGQIYSEGYQGPDTLLFAYLDRNSASDLVMAAAPTEFTTILGSDDNLGVSDRNVNFRIGDGRGVFDLNKVGEIIDEYIEDSISNINADVTVPVMPRTSDFSFVAEAGWGGRSAYGSLQTVLNELLQAEVELKQSEDEYNALLTEMEVAGKLIKEWVALQNYINQERNSGVSDITSELGTIASSKLLLEFLDLERALATGSGEAWGEMIPEIFGFSASAGSPAKGAIQLVGHIVANVIGIGGLVAVNDQVNAEMAVELDMLQLEVEESQIDDAKEFNGLVAEMRVLLAQEEAKRTEIGVRVQEMVILGQEYQSTLAEGFRLLAEREAFNKVLASSAQRNRYQDMIVRLSRNETLRNYQSAFEHAQRFVWLAAKAYEYETGLAESDPASATALLEEIIRTRTIGLWHEGERGEPRVGKGGLAGVLARLDLNYQTLAGQLGLNNPQYETGRLSMRHEHFRIATGNAATPASQERWRDVLWNSRVDDLWQVPVFRQLCRPFDSPEAGPQPGLVIPFSTEITPGKNVFGRELGGEDHAYSNSTFSTKIKALGVWFEGYNSTGLSTTPRVYLVPSGADVLRVSNADFPEERVWNVVEQRIPVPFAINTSDLLDTDFIPSIHSHHGSFGEVRRLTDFRAYHSSPGVAFDESQLVSNTRLITRSVWNTQWYLIIPGATLHADPEQGLQLFVGDREAPGISDIKLFFDTYSHEGY